MLFIRRSLLAVVAMTGAPGCTSDSNPVDPTPGAATFRVQACTSQTFAVRFTDPELVQRATDLIGRSEQPVLSGALARGDGGFNQPWSWHMVPGTAEFADLTIEVCDGCPRMVEENLDYWLGSVGRFCPWSSRIVARLD